MCANCKLPAAEYTVLLHHTVAVRKELTHMSSRYSQLTPPGQRAVLPPIYCSYLPSFLCFSIDSVRLQSMHILTSSHGTGRTADVIRVGVADSTFFFWKIMIVCSCFPCSQHRMLGELKKY